MIVNGRTELIEYIQKLENEVKFLRERNKDLRQKSWYQVYEENLKLQDEIKNLYTMITHHKQTIENVSSIADSYFKENKHLKEVIQSVETFVNQFTR